MKEFFFELFLKANLFYWYYLWKSLLMSYYCGWLLNLVLSMPKALPVVWLSGPLPSVIDPILLFHNDINTKRRQWYFRILSNYQTWNAIGTIYIKSWAYNKIICMSGQPARKQYILSLLWVVSFKVLTFFKSIPIYSIALNTSCKVGLENLTQGYKIR